MKRIGTLAMFSFIRAGTLPIGPELDAAALPNHLANGLRGAEARGVEVHTQSVTFSGGVFRLVSNWNVLVPFGSGVLTVDAQARQVLYELNYRQLILVATGMSSSMAVLISLVSVRDGALAAALLWMWLVGGNLLLGFGRFKSFLGRLIAIAPKTEQTNRGD